MSNADLLSQDEIDALLSGVDKGEIETEIDEEFSNSELTTYDFTNQDRIVQGRLPTLDLINERFVRNLRKSLAKMLRRTPYISVEGIQMMKFGDYLQTLIKPSNLNVIHVRPLKGAGLIVCNPKLVFSLVDCFFGGAGRFNNQHEGRDFTPTEMRIVRQFVDCVFVELEEAWVTVFPVKLEFINAEINPQFAGIVTPSEVVVITTVEIELDGVTGLMHITLPYSMIDPIRHLLVDNPLNDGTEMDELWNQIMQDEIKNATVTIGATLARKQMRLSDVMKLKAGDLVPLELPQTVIGRIDEVPVFRASYGASRGYAALKVVKLIRHSQIKNIPSNFGDGL